ncbi:MAG: DUF4268 domain-containing protein [Clostridia bacterium]|nr:DUF4268 domain-containing protein [Clostridia bacterium]
MNNLISLSKLFDKRIFRIPDYQRGYAWQMSQLSDFWEDLKNLAEDRYHYTGMLSLKKLKSSECQSWTEEKWLIDQDDYEAYHIVDGQQRLTTFIILVNSIINKATAEGIEYLNNSSLEEIKTRYIVEYQKPQRILKAYKFGYEKDNPSFMFLRYAILGEEAPSTLQETFYTLNLEQAKKFFDDKINKLYADGGTRALEVLYGKLVNKLQFNIHDIDDDFDVFVAFETMNNRGKSLSNLEILKNRLIYLTTIFPDKAINTHEKNQLRCDINDAWREVYYQLGRNKKRPLNDDEYLKNHWIIYFAYSRNKGDDYIQFLLNKMFTANAVYGLKSGFDEYDTFENDDYVEDGSETTEYVDDAFDSVLYPKEISNYIKSIKDLAKYWYDSYFPYESENLTEKEKIWVDRLNRIGMGYFRPLIAVVISKRATTSLDDRIELFRAIERYIFIGFKLGSSNYSYRNSEFYRAARSVYLNELSLSSLVKTLDGYADYDTEYSFSSFISRIKKRFDAGDGYYGWNTIKYFLYEYEYSLAEKTGISKISWELFSKTEKDKVSIEHILPQTPTKFYWRNNFRQFTEAEIKALSGALGNLLPLRQSVNSSLQNDSFYDKKHSSKVGRTGYDNGSHSEIEVSMNTEWTAKEIYDRTIHLLDFMIERWNITMPEDIMENLTCISFVNDGREVPLELTEDDFDDAIDTSNNSLGEMQRAFWSKFVEHCDNLGRHEDISIRKALAQNWYDIPVGANDYHLSFTITYNKYVTLLIYTYNPEAFKRLLSKKDKIEKAFGDELEWFTSRETSVEKRILYRMEADYFNPKEHEKIFNWMIEKFDLLYDALESVDE